MPALKTWTRKERTDAVAILALPDGRFTSSGLALDRKSKKWISRSRKEEAFPIKRQASTLLYPAGAEASRVILCAFPERDSRTNELREAAYAAGRIAKQHGFKRIAVCFDPETSQEIQAIGEGILLAAYSYKGYKSISNNHKPQLQTIYIQSGQRDDKALRKAKIFTKAAFVVRDLVNEPPNFLNPQKLAQIAADLAKRNALGVRIVEAKELESMGANAFLSVGKGSAIPNRMIEISYKPKDSKVHVCLVGKGVTFDSGGLSLKTDKGMEHMKSDMAGAATALACVCAAKELNLGVRVTALLMATENMPDGGANRPGDVIRAMNGKTIEITNTDAEGRLALADGLAHAQTLNPDYLIDIATLTGAQVVALGRLVAAVMGNDEDFIQSLIESGKRSGETIWQLPLMDHYRELIKSDIADVKNSSGIPDAGSIQGGLFLSEFVNHPRWIHLDIAGPSFQDREWSIYQRNGSGFGVRCLLTFLESLCEKS
jgi:leucyl aminopeptidase